MLCRVVPCAVAVAFLACSSSPPRATAPSAPQYGAPQYGAPQYPPPAGGMSPAQGRQPTSPPLVQYPPNAGAVQGLPTAPVAADPINGLDVAWLRARSQQILNELKASLPPDGQQRVVDIPLVVDSTPGDVNAFAGCDSARAFMAVTDGLFEITAWLSMAAAHDELFQTNKTNEYIALVAANLRPNVALPRPAPGFFSDTAHRDPTKVARQHRLFDEQIAFVLGHELAHHHLGHLPCTGNPGPLGSADVARLLSFKVPLFNQPNEAAADIAGINNLLNASKRQTPPGWTESGALLTLRFFEAVSGLSGLNLIFAFQRSHPIPSLRVPLIRQSANVWRATGGVGLPTPRLGG